MPMSLPTKKTFMKKPLSSFHSYASHFSINYDGLFSLHSPLCLSDLSLYGAAIRLTKAECQILCDPMHCRLLSHFGEWHQFVFSDSSNLDVNQIMTNQAILFIYGMFARLREDLSTIKWHINFRLKLHHLHAAEMFSGWICVTMWPILLC